MRRQTSKILESARLRDGEWASAPEQGMNGAFTLLGPGLATLRVIASDGTLPGSLGWEHVSVSTADRCPTWLEMCTIKNLFWDEEETVVQFHPPRSQYVNHHPFTLHLWRNREREAELPPSVLVGPRVESGKRRA